MVRICEEEQKDEETDRTGGRMMVLATNLPVNIYGWFPDVLQSESLAVVDQCDGFDVLPQLRGDDNTSHEGRE